MKKSILIFGAALTTFSLMALGYMNSNHSTADRQCKLEREKLVSVGCSKSTVDKLYFEDLFYDVNYPKVRWINYTLKTCFTT